MTEPRNLPLVQRCTYWSRGEQCDFRRVPGTTRCAIHHAPRPRPSIEAATDRLAHDLDKIYSVLP